MDGGVTGRFAKWPRAMGCGMGLISLHPRSGFKRKSVEIAILDKEKLLLELQPVAGFVDFGCDDGLAIASLWIADVVVLVVVFGREKLLECFYFGDDCFFKFFLCLTERLSRDALLFRIGVENNGSVLSADIIPLSIESGGVVNFPEEIEEALKANFCGIEGDLNHFSVACAARADLFVCRVFYGAASIAASDANDAGDDLINGFKAPEAAAA